MKLRSSLLASLLLTWPMGAPAAARDKPVRWELERTPELLRLTHDSEPVRYRGAGVYRTRLVLECRPAAKQLAAWIESEVKSGGSFTVRFDTEPAATLGRPGEPEWSNERQRYVLRVPAEEVPRFVSDTRTSERLMVRHRFSSIPHDVHYDLAGLEVAFEPLAEACAVPPPEPRTATAAPRPPRPSPKPDRRIGDWMVHESVSSVDDKLIVVLKAADRRQEMDMYVRCQESSVEAFFAPRRTVFEPDANQQSVTFTVSVDGGDGVQMVGPTATHFKAVFVPDGRPFVESLVGRRSLTVTYTLWEKPQTSTSTFSLSGFDEAAKAVLAACPAGR